LIVVDSYNHSFYATFTTATIIDSNKILGLIINQSPSQTRNTYIYIYFSQKYTSERSLWMVLSHVSLMHLIMEECGLFVLMTRFDFGRTKNSQNCPVCNLGDGVDPLHLVVYSRVFTFS